MKLNYKFLGEGEPIIILHGLFGMLDNWQTVGKTLAEDYMVALLDLRNHGKSPHSDVWDVPSMAEDVVEFMKDHEIRQASVLGHSMGGKVAMEIALAHPDLVSSLIIVDIAPKKYQPGHKLIFKGLNAVPIHEIQSRSIAEEVLSGTIDNWGIRQFLLKNISRRKEGGYRWKMNLPVIEAEYANILDASRTDAVYEGPTLFIRGGKSDYILEEDRDLIEQIFPNGVVVTIEGAGHWVHADNRDELVNEVRDFMTSYPHHI